MEQVSELRRYWVLGIGPERAEKLAPHETLEVPVGRFAAAMSPDDVALFWRREPAAGIFGWENEDGIFGWGRIVGMQYPEGDIGGATVNPLVYCEALFDTPVSPVVLADDRLHFEGLTVLRNDTGSAFRVTTLEAEALRPLLRDLAGADLPPPWNPDGGTYPWAVRRDYRFADLPAMVLDLMAQAPAPTDGAAHSAFDILLGWVAMNPGGEADTRQFLVSRFGKQIDEVMSGPQGKALDAARERLMAKSAPGILDQEAQQPGLGLVFMLDRARRAAIRTTGRERIHLRHLVAGLLTDFPAPPSQATTPPSGLDLAAARADFLAYVVPRCPDDDAEGWTGVLAGNFADLGTGDGREEPAEVSLDALLARVNADSTGGEDRLNITPEVEALASVMAARDVKPPFAMGLFGDWGSGKTFFMEKMRDRVIEIGDTVARAGPAAETAYCRNVVQIWFNAWHYVEANLWASLVDHIFTELGRAVGLRDEDQKKFDKLIEELGIAQERRREITDRLQDVQARRQETAEQISDLVEEMESRAAEHQAQVNRKIMTETFREDIGEDLKRKIDEIAKDSENLPGFAEFNKRAKEAHDTAQDILDLLGQAGVVAGRAANLWKSLYSAPIPPLFWIVLGGATLAVAVGGPLLAVKFAAWPGWATLSGFLAEGVAVGGVAVAWAKKGLSGASGVLDKLEGLRDRVLREVDAAEAERRAKVTALEAELDRIDGQIRGAEEEKRAIDREIEDLEAQLRAGPTQRLAQFIADRAESDDYRKHLGLLALIRRDFKKLSDLLRAVGADGGRGGDEPDLPRIDRIILYVDDLDRCPPGRVVDVLEAIHLLLAFPLFMVVVGVDSRWVSRCLEREYPLLLRRSEADGGGSRAKRFAADTQDYLEKIFQLPYWLRRPEPDGTSSLIGDLVGPTAAPEASSEDANGGGGTGGGGRPPRDPGEVLVPDEDRVEDEAPGYVDFLHAEPHGEPNDPPGPTPVQLNPAALSLTRAEADYMAALGGLVGRTPRSIKRFVNVYRVLKAADPRARRTDFTDGTRPGFREPLFLLAVVCGHPRAAKRFFKELAKASGTIDGLELAASPQRVAETPDDEAWGVFTQAFDRFSAPMDDSLSVARLNDWLPAIKRFDYRDWRHLGA
ncbi:MAG: hypothetical protein H6907_11990 [Hyphomicrobiales bacterium]|nr:hypothetical protein [Hyphomicrobiales bacterium]MCP5372443.1 hypothetical protein [Hyphomicrobiales bacterium]